MKMTIMKRFRFNNSKGSKAFQLALVIVVLVTVISCFVRIVDDSIVGRTKSNNNDNSNNLQQQQQQQLLDQYRMNPLGIPPGEAIALPSVRVQTTKIDNNNDKNDKATSDGVSVDKVRGIYGGKGDKAHLGGFTELDIQGISPAVWKYMISTLGVQSMLDVGCGRGISTVWFLLHGCKVLCVEGSHDAVEHSMIPNVTQNVVEHDFSRGPWWPKSTYDAVWSVEFLEHVGVQYHFNYITAFRKAALVFVTSSRWGGWHHVEVHPDDWWITKYESYGLKYDPKLTQIIRDIAVAEQGNGIAPNGEKFAAQHVFLSMKVFINPAVAALPEHAHLFPQHGCYGGRNETHFIHRKCSTGADKQQAKIETPLPQEYWPLELTPEMDTAWDTLVKQHITKPDATESGQ